MPRLFHDAMLDACLPSMFSMLLIFVAAYFLLMSFIDFSMPPL